MWEYFLVFLGAAIPWLEIALVVPLGIVAGLSPVWVMVLGFTGNLLTIMILIIAFDRINIWLMKRNEEKGKSQSKRSKRAKKVWIKYGLLGLLLLGPILIGTHLAAFIGMTLGADKKLTMIWSTLSIALWVLVFGIITALGFDFFVHESIL
ncbi:small multi-drug export protein [Paenisporosarcina sp. TG20]|uniref:small multi-drug export protein n=1 Tax=Paenisporosarcina sp. TG20 TaxID=1211706 RepID=UPI0002D7A2AA|nr:small multi-drug export protein [Paenisporosarcina sp. TG20]